MQSTSNIGTRSRLLSVYTDALGPNSHRIWFFLLILHKSLCSLWLFHVFYNVFSNPKNTFGKCFPKMFDAATSNVCRNWANALRVSFRVHKPLHIHATENPSNERAGLGGFVVRYPICKIVCGHVRCCEDIYSSLIKPPLSKARALVRQCGERVVEKLLLRPQKTLFETYNYHIDI